MFSSSKWHFKKICSDDIKKNMTEWTCRILKKQLNCVRRDFTPFLKVFLFFLECFENFIWKVLKRQTRWFLLGWEKTREYKMMKKHIMKNFPCIMNFFFFLYYALIKDIINKHRKSVSRATRMSIEAVSHLDHLQFTGCPP